MTVERIDIVVEDQILERNAEKGELLTLANELKKTPRVPVLMNDNQWFLQTSRGARIRDYLAGPRENLRSQILNLKWRAENLSVLDDQPIPMESVTFCPDLGSPRGTEFPMHWDWPVDQPLKCQHLLTEPEQIDTLSLPDPAGGLNATIIDWYQQMQVMVDDFDLRINGQKLPIHITTRYGGGPIPSAFALAGQNLFLWMAMDPQRVHHLMDLVTTSYLRCLDYFDDLVGKPRGESVGMGADSAEMVSPAMFREFVVPYYQRVWEAHPGNRPYHMCGQIGHLLEILRDDLQITELNGFGFPVDPQRLAEVMGGRVVLRGGPSPMLLCDGTVEEIRSQTRHYIQTLGQHGGYVFYLGGSLAPQTPFENIRTMIQAAAECDMPAP